jgi:hypothetical protein
MISQNVAEAKKGFSALKLDQISRTRRALIRQFKSASEPTTAA